MPMSFPQPHEGSPQPLSCREVYDLTLEGAVILDVRPEYETNYRVFDVPKVYFVTLKDLEKNYNEIPREEALIVADNAGLHCAWAARFLKEQGYEQVAYLAGGVLDWVRAGYPVVKDIDYELNGGCACRIKPRKDRG